MKPPIPFNLTLLSLAIASSFSVLAEDTEQKEVTLYKIQKYFEKKKLLDMLQDTNVSLSTKLLLLQDNSIKACNIIEGGLMKDFDFEF